MTTSFGKNRAAFALVEVVFALGVVTFCLVAVIGMLSTGFLAKKSADEQAAGGIVLQAIADDLRSASTNSASPPVYTGLGICTNVNWSVAGTTQDYTTLSMGGEPTSVSADQRLVAHVEVIPSTSTNTALISVAWPKQARWIASNKSWTNAQGSLSTYLIFLPRP